LFFANANFINNCAHLRSEITNSQDVILLNDGIAVDVAALLRFRTRFPENMNGTDFTPALLSRLDRQARLFLLGGRPAAVEAAAHALGCFPRVGIAGYVDGYSIWQDEADLIEQINGTYPDILLVAFGNPRQEEWILRNRSALDVPLILAVGALFDFVSGQIPRAPRILRTLRLEWFYRLIVEPRRLVGRYTIGIVIFFATALFGHGNSRAK
jgi:beta-1,4-glucosyltransferase